MGNLPGSGCKVPLDGIIMKNSLVPSLYFSHVCASCGVRKKKKGLGHTVCMCMCQKVTDFRDFGSWPGHLL